MEAEASDPSRPREEGSEQPTETDGPTPLGGILSLVGGALLVVGSFLDWAAASGAGTSVSATGTEGTEGWITLVAGVLVLAAGAAIVRRTGGRGVAILAIVAGLIGGGVGLYDAVMAEDIFLDLWAEELAREVGGSVEQLRALLDAAIQMGELAVTVAIGLYLVIAGGVLAIVGGAIAVGRGSAAPAHPASSTTEARQPPSETWASPSGPPPPPPASAAPQAQPAAPDLEPSPASGSELPAPPGSEPPESPGLEPPPSPWATPEPSEREQAGADENER
ncbi:MAG TPA: hypothetical protein VFZ96_06335 [Actinomycetota bacterium]|nr:hypothetical protein [Actinomycetota bacterium]